MVNMVETVKMGGKARLRLLLLGHEDVEDALLPVGGGGRRLAQGIADTVRASYGESCTLDISYRPCPSLVLLWQEAQGPADPQELQAQGVWDDALAAQFDSGLFAPQAEPWDIVVLSIRSDLITSLWQHRQAGYWVAPPADWRQRWTPAQQAWFEQSFEACGQLPTPQVSAALRQLIPAIKERVGAHVIVFTVSSYDPDDAVHAYAGRAETPVERIHRLNLTLIQLSTHEGISLIDVDRIIAELGGAAHVPQRLVYSDEALTALRHEFQRVLADIGFFERRPLVLQVGQRKKA